MCILYDKLLKLRQSFRITLYNIKHVCFYYNMFTPTKSEGNFDVVSIDPTYCYSKKLSKFRRRAQI